MCLLELKVGSVEISGLSLTMMKWARGLFNSLRGCSHTFAGSCSRIKGIVGFPGAPPWWRLTFHLTCIYCMRLFEGDNMRLVYLITLSGRCWLKLNNVNSRSVLNILQRPCSLHRKNPSGALITLSRPGFLWWWGINIYFKLNTLKESKHICEA